MVHKTPELKVLDLDKEFKADRTRFDGVLGMLVLNVGGVQVCTTSADKSKTALAKKTEFEVALGFLRTMLTNDGQDTFKAMRKQYYNDNWSVIESQLKKKGYTVDQAAFIEKAVAAELKFAQEQPEIKMGFVPKKSIKYMTKDQVMNLQMLYNKFFAKAGEEIAVDGKIGKQTEAAIKKMQEILFDAGCYDEKYAKAGKNKVVDGEMGVQTDKAIQNYLKKKADKSREWSLANAGPEKVIAALETKVKKSPEEKGGVENTKAYVGKLINKADQELARDGLTQEYRAKVVALKNALEEFATKLKDAVPTGND